MKSSSTPIKLSVLVVCLIGGAMFILVVPKLMVMAEDLGPNVPYALKLLVFVVHFVADWWLEIGLAAFVMAAMFGRRETSRKRDGR